MPVLCFPTTQQLHSRRCMPIKHPSSARCRTPAWRSLEIATCSAPPVKERRLHSATMRAHANNNGAQLACRGDNKDPGHTCVRRDRPRSPRDRSWFGLQRTRKQALLRTRARFRATPRRLQGTHSVRIKLSACLLDRPQRAPQRRQSLRSRCAWPRVALRSSAQVPASEAAHATRRPKRVPSRRVSDWSTLSL